MPRYVYRWMTLVVLLIVNLGVASNWYLKNHTLDGETIHSIATEDYNFSTFLAVGSNGFILRGDVNGSFFTPGVKPVNENLNAVIMYYGSPSTVVIAVGDNGTIIRSEDMGNSWTEIPKPTPNNLKTLIYNSGTGQVWAAGENGTMLVSTDNGATWEVKDLGTPDLDITKIVGDYSHSVLLGVKNDTTFVRKFQLTTEPYIEAAAGDTLADFKAASAHLFNGSLYIAGNNISSNNYQLFSRSTSGPALGLPSVLHNSALGTVTDIKLYQKSGSLAAAYNPNMGPSGPINFLWIATAQGAIYESNDLGVNYKKVFQEPANHSINSIVVRNGEAIGNEGVAYAAGAVESIYKNAFELRHSVPFVNDLFHNATDKLFLEFSTIADLNTVRNNVHIKSSLTGHLATNAEYELGDSTRINLVINRDALPATIVGESWNVLFDSGIKPLNDDGLSPGFKNVTFRSDFTPAQPAPIKFKQETAFPAMGKSSTNFVQAFFNENNHLDFISYAQDSLFIYEVNSSGKLNSKQSFYIGGAITVSTQLERQLESLDLNADGKMDLLLYDADEIITLLNTGSGSGFNFVVNPAKHTSVNIKQVIPWFADKNATPDILLLNDSLKTYLNVGINQFGTQQVVVSSNHSYSKIELGDLNMDGLPDLVTLNSGGTIGFGYGNGIGYFNFPFTTSENGYSDIKIGDFDSNRFLEIAAVKGNSLDIFEVSYSNHSQIQRNTNSPVITLATGNISKLIIAELGGMAATAPQINLLDLALITSDNKLRFFENKTMEINQFTLSEDTQSAMDITYSSDQILLSDLNHDANMDLILLEKATGNLHPILNSSWKPEFASYTTQSDGNHITWTKFPEAAGTFKEYRVLRSDNIHAPVENAVEIISDVNDTTYVDTDTRPFEQFRYRIEAVYDNDLSVRSDQIIQMNMVKYLNGPISGVIADTINGHVAQSNLVVEMGQVLQLEKGVHLAFSEQTRLDVFGALLINGQEEQMVRFSGTSENPQEKWRGIHFYPSSDTTNANWFNISGADTALFATQRPMRISKVGISRNERGIVANKAYFDISHIIADSNNVALNFTEQSVAKIKNVTIIDNNIGILNSDNAQADIKNAVIWNNQFQDIRSTPSATTRIKYSTFLNVLGTITSQHNQNRAPLYEENDEGDRVPAAMSPTVDAGDPADDFSLEPLPNGGRINQGVYGGLKFATRSLRPKLIVMPATLQLAAESGKSDTVQVIVENEGATDLVFTGFGVKNLTELFQLNGSLPSTLASMAKDSIQVVFKPTSEGTFTDTLQFFSNDPAFPVINAFLQGTTTVTAPLIVFDSSPRNFSFPVNQTREGSLLVKNSGDANLETRVHISTPALNSNWLEMDTTLHSVAPGDSTYISFKIVPAADLAEGLKTASMEMHSNDGKNPVVPFTIRFNPIFDTNPPMLAIKSHTDSISNYASIHVQLFVDDTTGRPIGDIPEKILKRYVLRKTLSQGDTTLAAEDSLAGSTIKFYPLDDGIYHLRVWAYDTRGNGYNGINAKTRTFKLNSTQHQLKKHKWQMVSMPRNTILNIENLPSDSLATLYRWESSKERYLAVDELITLGQKPGEAYWILLEKPRFLNAHAQTHAKLDDVIEIDLQQGWNQVGAPLGYVTLWKDMHFVRTDGSEMLMGQAAEADLIEDAVYRYSYHNDGTEGYLWNEIDKAAAVPWKGYWLNAKEAGKLRFTTVLADTINHKDGNAIEQDKNFNDRMQFNIALKSKTFVDAKNEFGFGAPMQTGKVVSEPPQMVAASRLYFIKDKKPLAQNILPGFSVEEKYKSWRLVLESNGKGAKHTLSWSAEALQSSGLNFFLVDVQKEKIVEMNKQTDYQTAPHSVNYPFEIYASYEADFKPPLLPARFRLSQNYPNPFNPSTTFRFGIPSAAAGKVVQLSIYNVLGQHIADVFNKQFKAGYHQVKWNAQNALGSGLASGVYFYKLKYKGTVLTRKMLFLK